MKIETVYRCRIDYDYVTAHEDYSKKTPIEKVEDFAYKLDRHPEFNGLRLSNSSGGPAWNAYLLVEGHDRNTVEKFSKQVTRYIKRFVNLHILE